MSELNPKYKHKRRESYSSLSLFAQCPMQYKLKYIDENYSDISSLPMEIGTLLHFILELKMGRYDDFSNEDLLAILNDGYKDEDNKFGEAVLGLNELKDKYYEIYNTPGKKSNITYGKKIENFTNRIISSKSGKWDCNNEWNVLAVEFPFEFSFEGIKIGGKIDRIDINKNGDFKITDYKSSDAIYDDKNLKTPLQMYIYAKAIKEYFGKYPIKSVYDFILLDEMQEAMSKGWEKRGDTALKKIINKLKDSYNTGNFPPKPTPLCYFCVFNENGCTGDKKCGGLCEYFSNWTYENKTFSVNKPYDETMKETSKKEFVW